MNCDDTQTDHIEYMGQKRGPNNTYVHDFEVRSKYFCLTKPQECTFIAKNQRFDLSSLRSNYETWTAYDTRPGKYKRPCISIKGSQKSPFLHKKLLLKIIFICNYSRFSK